MLNVSDPMVGYDTAGFKRLKPLSFSALFSLKTKLIGVLCARETVTENVSGYSRNPCSLNREREAV